MYMAHLRTIVQEIFASGDYLNTANTLRTTIDAAVQADPYKFYTYKFYRYNFIDIILYIQMIGLLK